MSSRHHTWHLRVTFEPNRFSSEQLAKVYEQLKPTQSREVLPPSADRRKTKKRRTRISGGEQ